MAGADVAAATVASDSVQLLRPYEMLFTGLSDDFADCRRFHGRDFCGGEGRVGIRDRPRTSGGLRGGRRSLSPSPKTNLEPRGSRVDAIIRGEEAQCRGFSSQDPRQQEQQKQMRATPRPKTAGAGFGGVQGVLSRMGGYEKVTKNKRRKPPFFTLIYD